VQYLRTANLNQYKNEFCLAGMQECSNANEMEMSFNFVLPPDSSDNHLVYSTTDKEVSSVQQD